MRALEAAGIPEDQISLVVSTLDDAVGETHPAQSDTIEVAGTGSAIGAAIGGAGGLLAGLGALAIPGLGPVVAAGWLATTLIGAAAGAAIGGATGGIIGSLIGSGVHEQDAHVVAEGVRRGGSVVSVHIEEAQTEAVEAIFTRLEQVDIADRRAFYEGEGWQSFDPAAPAYPRDRERHGLENLPGPF